MKEPRSLFDEWWQGGGEEWSKDVVRKGPAQVRDAVAFGFGAGIAAARETEITETFDFEKLLHKMRWIEKRDNLLLWCRQDEEKLMEAAKKELREER